MVQWKFGGDMNGGFLAILELQIRVCLRYIEFLWGVIFLVRESDKKCEKFKNEN